MLRDNPAFIVGDPRAERLWAHAKQQVQKEYPHVKKGSDRYWRLVNGIWRRMYYRVGGGDLDDDRPTKSNPVQEAAGPRSLSVANHYIRFHGCDPSDVTELQVQSPINMTCIGDGVDVGYGIIDEDSSKGPHKYVHEFGPGVMVYKAFPGGEKRVSLPTEWTVLGDALGFTYRGDGKGPREVKGSRQKRLCWNPTKQLLCIISVRRGVQYMFRGGRMRVNDWIRD